MKVILNATLQLGLVNVPVGVCTAAREKTIHFRQLHSDCLKPIKMPRTCEHCADKRLDSADIVKGFEFAKNQFVVIEDEELEALSADRSRIVQMNKFVPRNAISPLFVFNTYWLKPNPMFVSTYSIFSHVLHHKQVSALGKAFLWGKEHPCAVTAHDGGVLGLHMLYALDEVIDTSEIEEMITAAPEEETSLAYDIVTALTTPMEAEDLSIETRRRMENFLAARVAGKQFEMPKPVEPTPTVNILDALKQTVKAVRTTA